MAAPVLGPLGTPNRERGQSGSRAAFTQEKVVVQTAQTCPLKAVLQEGRAGLSSGGAEKRVAGRGCAGCYRGAVMEAVTRVAPVWLELTSQLHGQPGHSLRECSAHCPLFSVMGPDQESNRTSWCPGQGSIT